MSFGKEPQTTGQHAASIRQDAAPVASCVWCGRPVAEEEAFWLRAGARLCPDCATDAGRIAAEQRLGKAPPPGSR